MADSAEVYHLLCELVADAKRRGLVGPVCEPGEVLIYDEYGAVLCKVSIRSGTPGESPPADEPTVIDAAGD